MIAGQKYFSPADFSQHIVRGGIGNQMGHILGLPRAAQGEYEVSDKEAAIIRRRIYEVNKYHPRGYKFRTMREGRLLLVWRIK